MQKTPEFLSRRKDLLALAGLVAGGLFLYVATVAPTVTWGDDATLQLAAVEGVLQASAGSHPAWVVLAHLLTKLSLGELAYRVNLASALAGAVTLGLLYLSLRALPVSRPAGILATVAFAVSHTFWAHAVRAEVYTLTLATMALMVVVGFAWHRTGQDRYLILLGLTIGLAFATHLLAVLYLPALAWLLIARRRQLTRRSLICLGISTFLALLPLVYLLWRDAQRMQSDLQTTLRWALFTFDNYDFGGRMLAFSADTFAGDAAQWILFLGYQFFGLALPLGAAGAVLSWRRLSRDAAVFVAFQYLAPAVFAFSYAVGDRYVFFLPSYLAFTAWLAVGIDAVLRTWRDRRAGAAFPGPLVISLGLLLVVIPVLTYRLTPDIMQHYGWHVREGRQVPGPNGRYFLLWPPKAGYFDARDYAEVALAAAPQHALLLADPSLAAPMQFLQRTENIRPDVMVHFCCWDIDAVLAANSQRPAALADDASEIYPIDRLQMEYQIIARAPIYLLKPFDK